MSDEPDPVSWVLVERGWKVVDANGAKVGKVDEVLADEQTDIFHGLIVNGKEVDADRIAEIREGQIRLR
jgi:sporulation protein YlmC with PRC-barrel domain